jgi:hypothetical protein
MLRLKYHLIIFSVLFNGCQSCEKYHIVEKPKTEKKEEEIRDKNTFKTILTTLNEIRRKRNEINGYLKKPLVERTNHDLAYISSDIQDIIDRAYEKAEKLNNTLLTETEQILLERIVIEVGKLEELDEELKEEYESEVDSCEDT